MLSRRRDRPLSVVLSYRFIFVAVVPIIAVALLAVFQFAPGIRADIARQQEAMAAAVTGQVERYFSIATRELATMIKLIESRSLGWGEINSLLDTYASASEFYEAVYLTDDNGLVSAIGLPETERGQRKNHLGLDFSQRDFYKQARSENKAAWSNSFLSPISGRMAIAVAQPLGERMLIGEVAVAPLPALAKDIGERGGLIVMMLDRQNQLVAHSNNAHAGQQMNLSNLPVVEAARRGPQSKLATEFLFDDDMLVGSAQTLAGLDWLIVVAQREQIAYAQINGMWERIVIGVLLAMLSAGILAVATARMVAISFKRYGEQAKSIADGSYDSPQLPSQIAEFNLLQENLARTAQAIRDRERGMREAREEVEQLNITLEERVEERTDELTRANEELVTTLDTLQHTQDELLRSEKLSALGSMVAGIAHELNTPIGNGMMAASTLEDHAKNFQSELDSGQLRRRSLDEFMRNNLTANSILLRNLRRAAELIASFKQVAVDQTSSQRRTFNVEEVINEILLSLNPTLKKTPYIVKTEIAENLSLDSYPGPLGQVIVNLINNAVLHAFDGRAHGIIRIAVSAAGNNSVHLTISDDGVGVPAEHLSRIFDPFFTTKLGQGGSGLGLNIVHNLITGLLGGNVSVFSNKGQGTRFEIELPRSAPRGVATVEA